MNSSRQSLLWINEGSSTLVSYLSFLELSAGNGWGNKQMPRFSWVRGTGKVPAFPLAPEGFCFYPFPSGSGCCSGAVGFNKGFSPFSPRISQLLFCIRKDPNTQELLSPVLHHEPITISRPACTGVHAHTGVHA